ncbi:MAG: D-2-hydroxyacid dehydrogenase [Chloroflexi bacterium]|nr:D-2-hydroxyacid dehydrogenase [Chloroflexota bacterium]
MKDGVNILIAVNPNPEALGEVRQLANGGEVNIIKPYDPGTNLPKEQIDKVEVLFADYPPHNLQEMTSLEWIQLGSAGYEQIYDYPLTQMGIRVSNASGVNDIPIAEWCIAMMLMFERDIRGLLEMQKQRGWDRQARFQSELRGRRVGIIGYGNIGRTVASLSHAMGLEVWAMSRQPIGPRPNRYTPLGVGDPEGTIPVRTFTLDQMSAFLPHLDYLVLTTPMTPTTNGLLGEAELRLLKPSAVILNPSRGRLVKEDALLRALRENWIAGAALDTHYHYPMPPDHPLWALPNVIMTPHISGSHGARFYSKRLWELFIQNLDRYKHDQPLLNELVAGDINPKR